MVFGRMSHENSVECDDGGHAVDDGRHPREHTGIMSTHALQLLLLAVQVCCPLFFSDCRNWLEGDFELKGLPRGYSSESASRIIRPQP